MYSRTLMAQTWMAHQPPLAGINALVPTAHLTPKAPIMTAADDES